MTKINGRFLPIAAALTLVSTGAPADTTAFTLHGGSLVELVFLESDDAAPLATFEEAVESAGGDYLVGFEVVLNDTLEHPATHLAMVQWTDPTGRVAAEEAYETLGKSFLDTGFFAVGERTRVSLSDDKVYDFTSAWTIASTPEEMGIVMQVIGKYFQLVGPVIQEYGVETKAFMMAHPAAPAVAGADFDAQITGLFQWNSVEDQKRFSADERWLEHVDIRDATMARKEDTLLARLVD